MTPGFTRREFIRLTGAGIAVASFPSCNGDSSGSSAAAQSARFFTQSDYDLIDAAVSRLIPDDTNPDGSPAPGAGAARVVDYIDRLLAVFDDDAPFIFAGGPASDRNPEPAAALCSADIPPNGPGPNAFADPAPLSRRQEISWRARVLGTAALGAEGDFLRANNKALGEGDANGDLPGLQDAYRQGIRDLNDFANQLFGQNFAALADLQKDLVLQLNPNQGFIDTLFAHAVEGMYANPEYGGNQPPDRSRAATGADGDNRPLGWGYMGFEGDRQPLGYTIFDPLSQTYCEIPAHPMSTPNPGSDPFPLDAATIAVLPELLANLRLRR